MNQARMAAQQKSNRRSSKGMSPGRSMAQFGHAGHAGKSQSQAQKHQKAGIHTPSSGPGSNPNMGQTPPKQTANQFSTPTPTPTPTVTTGGQSPFPYTKQVGITSNYVNPIFRKHIIDRARQYHQPRSFLENLQNLYGQDVTQIGYIPKSFEPKKPLKKTAWDYATTKGVGAQEFADWRKTKPASLFEEYHSDYGDELQRQLELSDKIEILGEDYVKGIDIKGWGDSYDEKRQAVSTLLGDVETKKKELKEAEGDWMDKEDIERNAKSQLQSGYLENKDRLDDLGITSLEEYKEFLNKSIGLASGGLVNLYKYGGIV